VRRLPAVLLTDGLAGWTLEADMTGIELIATERMRQVKQEGWTPEHDDEHDDESLALAAICYAAPIPIFRRKGGETYFEFLDPWPDSWDVEWDKRPFDSYNGEPREPTPAERIRMLVKAGALIAAEIDRLQRAALKTPNAQAQGAEGGLIAGGSPGATGSAAHVAERGQNDE